MSMQPPRKSSLTEKDLEVPYLRLLLQQKNVGVELDKLVKEVVGCEDAFIKKSLKPSSLEHARGTVNSKQEQQSDYSPAFAYYESEGSHQRNCESPTRTIGAASLGLEPIGMTTRSKSRMQCSRLGSGYANYPTPGPTPTLTDKFDHVASLQPYSPVSLASPEEVQSAFAGLVEDNGIFFSEDEHYCGHFQRNEDGGGIVSRFAAGPKRQHHASPTLPYAPSVLGHIASYANGDKLPPSSSEFPLGSSPVQVLSLEESPSAKSSNPRGRYGGSGRRGIIAPDRTTIIGETAIATIRRSRKLTTEKAETSTGITTALAVIKPAPLTGLVATPTAVIETQKRRDHPRKLAYSSKMLGDINPIAERRKAGKGPQASNTPYYPSLVVRLKVDYSKLPFLK